MLLQSTHPRACRIYTFIVLTQPMPTNFTSLDLFVWHEEGMLELTPKFQRRSVWSPAARSFFIDSLLRGYPVPPLHIRMLPSALAQRPKREVIDGQQRLRTIFDFMQNKIRLGRNLHADWASKSFEQLTDEQRERLKLSQFHVYQYQAIDDETVLEIFARLNTYSVRLNKQELRNGKYFGEFKHLVYNLSRDYLSFWRTNHVFGESAIARMLEAEFVSELLVLQFDGFQDKKGSLDSYYAGLDEDWPATPTRLPRGRGALFKPKAWLSSEAAEEHFRSTFDHMTEQVGDLVPSTPFRRVPLLYTLFSVYYHLMYGLPGQGSPIRRRVPTASEVLSIRAAIGECAVAYDVDRRDEAVPAWERSFALASARQTDNIGPRQIRFEEFWRRAGVR